ncbi:uncharacterized protein LOC135941517 [Cloeon dipterum]|uniref:uncharacterized protein LOC135941517 n=1 Tax=Cloeon dipterum TaxID=197152 RepID=UPI00322017E9
MVISQSKIVRVSEELAKQLGQKYAQNPPRVAIVPDPPEARHQDFRADGLYVEEGLFRELQHQQVALEVRVRELKEALSQHYTPLRRPQHRVLPPAKAEPPLQVLVECLRAHPDHPLKCYPYAKEFADSAKL